MAARFRAAAFRAATRWAAIIAARAAIFPGFAAGDGAFRVAWAIAAGSITTGTLIAPLKFAAFAAGSIRARTVVAMRCVVRLVGPWLVLARTIAAWALSVRSVAERRSSAILAVRWPCTALLTVAACAARTGAVITATAFTTGRTSSGL